MQTSFRSRLQVAQESARIIVEEGVSDYHAAKQKAVARLHMNYAAVLPSNHEIDQALTEYHKIYRASEQRAYIDFLRSVALKAMRYLDVFSPRLVGAVLDGNAGKFSSITLHLFPESPEDVMISLMRSGIPFAEASHEVIDSRGNKDTFPAFNFIFDETPIELKIFSPSNLRQTPKTLRRASIASIEALIQNK